MPFWGPFQLKWRLRLKCNPNTRLEFYEHWSKLPKPDQALLNSYTLNFYIFFFRLRNSSLFSIYSTYVIQKRACCLRLQKVSLSQHLLYQFFQKWVKSPVTWTWWHATHITDDSPLSQEISTTFLCVNILRTPVNHLTLNIWS